MLIYHAKNPNFGFSIARPDPKWPEDYQLVAQVNTTSLEVAFQWTNTTDKPWWENAGVKSFVGPARSTSVGDIAILNGKVWYCDHVGWRELK